MVISGTAKKLFSKKLTFIAASRVCKEEGNYFLHLTARSCTDRCAGRAAVALFYTVSYGACKDACKPIKALARFFSFFFFKLFRTGV